MSAYRVTTTVNRLVVGDRLTTGQVIKVLGPVVRDRHVNRSIRAIQFEGEQFSRTWNAATSVVVLREELMVAPVSAPVVEQPAYQSHDRWTPGTWCGD